jgi:RND family efflux transporter MFP subunit
LETNVAYVRGSNREASVNKIWNKEVNPMRLETLSRNQKVWSSATAGILLLGVIGLFAATRSKKPQAPPPSVVEVVQVEQKDVPIYSEWIGTTEGMVNAEIRAQVSGYLLRQNYTEGSFVRKGQLLFEIDGRPFQAALEQAKGKLAQAQGQLGQANSQFTQNEAQVGQAQAQVSQAQAQLAQAEANQLKTQLDVNKYGPLREQKAVTQQDLDNAVQANRAALAQVEAGKAGVQTSQAQVRAAVAQVGTAKATIASARAGVKSASADVETAQLNLGFTRITSPIDGIAGIAQAQVGNLVGPTTNVLTTVSTVDPIKVYFTASEQDYLDYARRHPTQSERDEAASQLELKLILSDGTTFPQTGRFFVADRQVDQTTGAIRLAGIFPNPNNTLRPGQYGRVRAETSLKEGALVVPQRAVSELQGSYQVAVVGADNKVSIRPVKVGERDGTMWIIDEGLKPGERVVAEGTQKVRPDMVVNPKPFVAPSSTPAQ